MDNITTESQLFLLHMNLVHLSRLFSEKSLNLGDTEDFDSETHECVPTDLFKAERRMLVILLLIFQIMCNFEIVLRFKFQF